MSLMKSVDVGSDFVLPDFKLKDADGIEYYSNSLIGKNGLLLVVTCNHCPYAKAVWKRVVDISRYAKKLDINTVAVNPNIHPNYPEDQPVYMKSLAKEIGIDFPYLVDETQEVAKLLKAQCTPDIYLFNKDGKIFYHGRIDDNWQDENQVKNEELKEAVTLLFNQKEPPKVQYPSMGCSIKWLDTVLG